MIEIPGRHPKPPQALTQTVNETPSIRLSDYGMPNILPQGGESAEDDPFCGEVPDDRQGYAAYRTFHEQKMNQLIGGGKSMSLHASCAVQLPNGREGCMKGNRQDHAGAGIVIACNHVIYQDPENPEGGRFYPLYRGEGSGFFLCKTCMKLEERHKLNFDYGVSMKCAKCVLEGIMRVTERFPDRWINLQSV